MLQDALRAVFFDAGDGGGGSAVGAGGGGEGSATNQGGDAGKGGESTPKSPTTYDELIQGLPDDQRKLVEERTKAQSAEAEKTRKAHESQIADLKKKAEKGSELEAELERMQAEVAESNRRARFAEQAASRGVANVELAYVAARERGLFDQEGNPNWDSIKEAFPQVFTTPVTPKGDAGAGNGEGPTGFDGNRFLRQMAGMEHN